MPSSSAKKSMLWSPLKKGDIVDVVAPAFACTPEELRGALEFLVSWGVEPRIPKQIFRRDILCSSDDRSRFEYLKAALQAPDSSAVWCVRGGYGALRLIPELVKLKRPAGPSKLFIGLSDITSLHLFLNQKWKWPTLHGPLLERLGMGRAQPKYVRELKRLLFGSSPSISFSRLKPLNSAAKRREGLLRGTVSGGNLITLQSSLMTSVEWDPRGRFLFFEDVGERGYRVDRVLSHLAQAGFFDHAKAVLFGDFTGGYESNGKSLVSGVLARFAGEMKIPVMSGLRTGHGPVQRPLPLGTPAELRLGISPVLTCQSGAKA